LAIGFSCDRAGLAGPAFFEQGYLRW